MPSTTTRILGDVSDEIFGYGLDTNISNLQIYLLPIIQTEKYLIPINKLEKKVFDFYEQIEKYFIPIILIRQISLLTIPTMVDWWSD